MNNRPVWWPQFKNIFSPHRHENEQGNEHGMGLPGYAIDNASTSQFASTLIFYDIASNGVNNSPPFWSSEIHHRHQ